MIIEDFKLAVALDDAGAAAIKIFHGGLPIILKFNVAQTRELADFLANGGMVAETPTALPEKPSGG